MTQKQSRAAKKIGAVWRTRSATREQCRRLLRDTSRFVVAFYANPRLPVQLNMPFLPNLTREMKHLMTSVSAFDVSIEPCSSIHDMHTRIRQFRPRIVMYSGHSTENTLMLEDPHTGRALMAQPAAVYETLNVASVRVVVLLGCHTRSTLAYVCTNDRRGIGFATRVDDAAARSFAYGLIQELRRQTRTKRVSAQRLYDSGLAAFHADGFRVGDPDHDRTHHGIPVLL